MRLPTLLALAAALLAAFTLPALPAAAQVTFTVNVTADTPDTATNGVCDADADAPGLQCTLRAALQEAEATAAADFIHFDIPGAGVHTIAVVGTDLPVLFQPATIDGYTQPGASPNTNGPTQGTNAAIRIEIVNGGGRLDGLDLCFGDKTVRGLAIGGFADHGVLIECNGTAGHVIEGCFIGTDASGTLARPNGFHGVQIASASANRIGGTVPGARNVISGNGRFGVVVSSSGSGQPATGNLVQGNLIGTDASGTAAVPNGASGDGGGVVIGANQGSAAGNVVGGAAGARNVISGNVGPGVLLSGVPSFVGVRVEGNVIGTDVTGILPLPNTGAGVLLDGPAGVAVGGSAPGAGNVIAHNGGAGVSVGRSAGNRVLGNALFANGGLGVDLGAVGPAPNDAGDADEGANRLQNTPALDRAALTDAGGLTVTYRVDTDPANATYPLRVEFFRADAGAEGAALLGSDAYSASDYTGCGTPPCPKTVTFTPAAPVAPGDVFVGTATDDDGSTSEFTAQLTVSDDPGAAGLADTLHGPSPNPSAGRVAFAFDLAATGRVRLTVSDALGREVAVVVDGERVTGRHESAFDTGRLAPGVYVVQLTAGAAVQTRRLTVVR